MASRIAVVNDVHWVAMRIYTKMLQDVGFEVHCTGGSFRGMVPLYSCKHAKHTTGCKGPIEFSALPPDALYIDTHPKAIQRLRAAKWNGPILLMWIMPVGHGWVREHLKPEGKVGSLAFSTSVGNAIREMDVCPSDRFWPPYVGELNRDPRKDVGDYLVTIVENAAGWSNVGILDHLRHHPKAKLELYGGGPPSWSQKIPHPDLMKKLRRSLAMYHLKPFDTPGFAVMEAALQAVPIIFCPAWLKSTQEEMFVDGESCLSVPTEMDAVLGAAERLRDPKENARIGLEGRRRMVEATDWEKNRVRFKALIDSIDAL